MHFKIMEFNLSYFPSYLKEVSYSHNLPFFFNYTYSNLNYLNFKFSKFFFIFTSTNYFYLNNAKFLNDVYSYYYQFLNEKKLNSLQSFYFFSKNFRNFKLLRNSRVYSLPRKNSLNSKNSKKSTNSHFNKIYFFLKKIDNIFYFYFHENFFFDKLATFNLMKLN